MYECRIKENFKIKESKGKNKRTSHQLCFASFLYFPNDLSFAFLATIALVGYALWKEQDNGPMLTCSPPQESRMSPMLTLVLSETR